MRKYNPADICNRRRYKIVSDLLVNSYRNQEAIFANRTASWPERQIFEPEVIANASAEDKIFTTFLAGLFLRGRITTDRAVKAFVKIIEQCPWSIDKSCELSKIHSAELDWAIDCAGLGHVGNQIKKYWYHNAQIMCRINCLGSLLGTINDFGEALYVFGTPKSAGESKRFNHLKNLGLLGYGGTGKVLSLVMQMLIEEKLTESFHLPVSADFHLISIYLRTGAITPPLGVKTHYTLARLVRDLSLEMMPKDDISYNNIISRATYQLGVTTCPANGAFGRKNPRCRDCPLVKYCNRNVQNRTYHQNGYLEVQT